MNFEEALKAMRSGAKIRVPSMPEDEYYQACYVKINRELFNIEPESLEEVKERGMSIVWMKGDRQHPDMQPKWDLYDPKTDPCKHGFFPMICIFLLMRDDWEVIK